MHLSLREIPFLFVNLLTVKQMKALFFFFFSPSDYSNNLSDEDNKKIYGKCNNPNGHGHNYKGLLLSSFIPSKKKK